MCHINKTEVELDSFRVYKTTKILLQLLSTPAVYVRHQLWSCVAHRAFPKLLLVQNFFRKIATNFLFWRLCQGLKHSEENLHTKLDIKKRFNARQCSTLNVRLEPTTLRLRVSCSTDWASRAPCAQNCVKYRSENEYSLNVLTVRLSLSVAKPSREFTAKLSGYLQNNRELKWTRKCVDYSGA